MDDIATLRTRYKRHGVNVAVIRDQKVVIPATVQSIGKKYITVYPNGCGWPIKFDMTDDLKPVGDLRYRYELFESCEVADHELDRRSWIRCIRQNFSSYQMRFLDMTDEELSSLLQLVEKYGGHND